MRGAFDELRDSCGSNVGALEQGVGEHFISFFCVGGTVLLLCGCAAPRVFKSMPWMLLHYLSVFSLLCFLMLSSFDPTVGTSADQGEL